MAWIPVLFFVSLFGLVLAAALWSAQSAKTKLPSEEIDQAEEPNNNVGLTIFFWIVIIFLIIAIVAGYIPW